METEDEDSVKMLMDMGFPDEDEVRAALRMAKNDISEAVVFLTDENFKSNMYRPTSQALAVPSPSNLSNSTRRTTTRCRRVRWEETSLVFPFDELLQLERRVGKDQWSIPYKREESLGKCLLAACLSEADDNCRRFTSRVMMESFNKLLTNSAVYSWSLEIHQGIGTMLELFVGLLIARLPHAPVPCDWLSLILAQAFDPETAWNQKNKSKNPSIRSGTDAEKDFASSIHVKSGTYGWLVDLINYFGYQGGFEQVELCFERPELSPAEMSALLAPLGRGAELLVADRVKPLLSPALDRALAYLVSLDENKLNGKDAQAVLELLVTLKRLCCHLWTENENKITELQLSILVRMLKTPNFSTRMNALQEISRIIEDTRRAARYVLDAEQIQAWMSEQGVLSLALEGNIDQKQYTDRIKAIIEFLGPHLSTEDLSKIWSMQSRHAIQVMENIHCMMAAASVSFSAPQLQHLISLIERSWEGGKPWQQEGLLQLAGRIGRQRADPASAGRMLELLWRLAHAPRLGGRLVDMAMELHTEVLAEGSGDEQVRLYISKCVEDISSHTWTVPALRHLHNIMVKIIHGTKSYIKIDKAAFSDLMYGQHDILRLITRSLSACHQMAVREAGGELHHDVFYDGEYKHGQCLSTHLEVLQYLLKDSRVPLDWERVTDVWAALVDNADACADDRTTCLNWFTDCVSELGREPQQRFFTDKLLRLDPVQLTAAGLRCFKTYFERVNLDKGVSRRVAANIVFGSQAAVGVDYLWRILTEVADEGIARAAIDQLLAIYYLNLEPRLKRDPASLHNKFYNECYSRLEACRAALCSGSDVQMAPVTPDSPVSSPSKGSSRRHSSETSSNGCPERRGLSRLLSLVQAYVEVIEGLNAEPRSILPHGATFRGAPLTVTLVHDSTELTVQAHTNESVQSLKSRAAALLKLSTASVQLLLNEADLDKPHQLLHRAGVTGAVKLTVRSVGSATARSRDVEVGGLDRTPPARGSSERSLPGVVMAAGGAFGTLCRLAELRDATITAGARAILHLMPTEAAVLSGKLMPCRSEGGAAEAARSFCRAFLEQGGLTELIAVLRREPYLLCDRPDLSPAQPAAGSKPTPAKKSALDATAAVCIDTVHSLSAGEFNDTVSCLLRLAWAAAAGRLAQGTAVAVRDKRSPVEFYLDERRRQSSTGSTTSSASESDSGGLHAGLCARQTELADSDALVARLALQLMLACLQKRPQALGCVYGLSYVRECIVDILLGSPSADVRQVMADQLLLLSQLTAPDVAPSPRDFLTQVVLKTRVPLWVPSGSSRAGSQRLLLQSAQYFGLRAHLLTALTAADQARLSVSVVSMIEDETGWLQNFSPAPAYDGAAGAADDVLLAGHLDLVRALVTCQGASRPGVGQTLISTLLDDFLFPASRRQGSDCSPVSLPRCQGASSRTAAYRLLVELCRDCRENLELVCDQLVSRHHTFDGELSKEFEYAPPLDSRAACNYVGLRNAGATCYMNSVLQQLYMVPGLREAVLGVQDDQVTEDSELCQLQMVFGHLLELKLQYFSPERFWTVFKLRGQPINVREQQDAYEFFTHLLDQVDEQLRRIQREPVFQQVFEGTFCDQKICQDCPHRYEREETFNALNLAVKSGSLQESLQQFVREEIMDGDNSYFCDKCGKKREAVKRTLIKSLPPVLVIQLKRFGYDWLAGHSIKFDGFFQFPFTLDMGPYTEEGVTAAQAPPAPLAAGAGDALRQRISLQTPVPVLYELVGVVVHSGQASAGHYYSYVKDRRGSSLSNPNKGNWYKFNDTTIEPVDMSEEFLEQECFGGTYKVKVSDTVQSKWGPSEALPETRLRYWNGYMLFYEQVNDRLKTPRTPRKSMSASRVSHRQSSRSVSRRNEDSLCQLTELVQQGDASDLFPDHMPSAVHQVVRDTNLKFMQNREIYSDEYFNFVYDLVNCNMGSGDASLAVPSLRLAVHFLLHTYLRARRRRGRSWHVHSRTNVPHCMERAFERSGIAARPFLLVCDNAAVRSDFTQLILIGVRAHFHHGGTTWKKHFPDSIRTCSQYFSLLSDYASLGPAQCDHVLSLNTLPRLVLLLLGPVGSSPRWTVSQTRQLGDLHTLAAQLVLSCVPAETDAPEARADDYVREVITALREPSWQPDRVVRMLVRASRGQRQFSIRLTTALMRSFGSIPCNELRHLSQTLAELVALEDSCQTERLDIILDGVPGEGADAVEGMLGMIRLTSGANSRRAYQCIKFLVAVAARADALKRRLLSATQRWLWAISWLREQMSQQAGGWEPPEQSAVDATSNDDSSGRMFRRTTSAQMTLDECSRLFTVEDAEMDVASGGWEPN
ncbi:ubiquitin carboxyl-terminal hydrolase 24-like [Pollicipes pollicipes]|uniref:ubiquitin carboxyl-terminal hydrolase 24-like n=1 Tax=Pollicipes pollicipes TaxID=41117 RepID=UPI001884BBE0|nr:ubiquitin carboxyl-terminal hydrolase 24-like [Pollicipes pollicipes]